MQRVFLKRFAPPLSAWMLAAACAVLPASAAEPVDYLKQVKPILAHRCFSCHGALRQKGGLRLDAASLVFTGGDSGATVVPGKAEASLLIERVSAEKDSRMPPAEEGEGLSAEQIELLKVWINQGANAPDEQTPPDPRLHWAYQPPVRHPLPKPGGETPAAANPIDAFLLEAQREQGVVARPPAGKEVLLRRIYFDLVGLPPTRDELHAFLADSSDGAYDQVVDRLLASPHYGERWGRHWMDVWRYSDWFGLGQDVRYSQKHIWRWRDWIVESLNADKGYDRMVVEMLAGDELAPDDPETLRATGYLARNWYLFNRNYWLDDVVHHTGKAFLGITINCTRCHDHKYDPISQEAYYRLRAFFEPHGVRYDPVAGQPDTNADGIPRAYDRELDPQTYLFVRGNEESPDKSRTMQPMLPALFDNVELAIRPIDLPVTAYYPALRPEVRRAEQERAEAEVRDRAADARRARSSLAQLEYRRQLAGGAAAPVAAPVPGDRPAVLAAAPEVQPILADDFQQPRPEVWKEVRGTWTFAGNRLVHENLQGPQSRLETLQTLPRDFTAALRFKLTGGGTRSLGMAFDMDERGMTGVFVSPAGPKVQIYQILDGAETYPPGAIRQRPIDNDREYELKFAIRDRLVNVWLNGEFQFAHERGIPRRTGRFALTIYQAKVEFLSVAVEPLPDDAVLTRAGEQPAAEAVPPVSGDRLQAAVHKAAEGLAIAGQMLELARGRLAALHARQAAELAKYADPQPANLAELAQAAAAAEVRAKLVQAQLNEQTAADQLAGAKADLQARPDDQKLKTAAETAEKALAKARADLQAAEAAAEQPAASYSPLGEVYPVQSTGRRLALARWIADRNNPLTARVAVNHIWARHFGEPLVGSMFDFGLRTPRPRHHQLLDYLAVELMESGWSMKRLHRLIVTSAAYKRSSSAGSGDNPNLKLDPDNLTYWKMNPRRLEGEIIRDALLALTGKLDRTAGGPDLPVSQAADGARRTIYYRYARDDKIKFLEYFDTPSVEECYRRHESIVPQQALAMSNSRMALTRAMELAALIDKEVGPGESPEAAAAFVAQAFERILTRAPTPAEQSASLEFLGDVAQALAGREDARLRARQNLVHVLLNHNDFVTVR